MRPLCISKKDCDVSLTGGSLGKVHRQQFWYAAGACGMCEIKAEHNICMENLLCL